MTGSGQRHTMLGTGLTSLNVLGIIGGHELCDIYRMLIPFAANRYKVITLEQAPMTPELYRQFDLIVMSRIAPFELKTIEEVAECGKIIFDIDDEMTLYHRAERDILWSKKMEFMIRRCDAITTPTPYLSNLYGERYGKPSAVLPNYIIPEQWAESHRIDETLTIGIAGGDSHYADWRLVEEALHKVVREFPVKVVVAGFLPDYLDKPWVTHIPFVPYDELPDVVRQFDIGLCPLPVTNFNLCKSEIKAVEYMASARDLPYGKQGGVCVLASNMPVYRRAVNHKSNGLLVKDDEWYDAIKTVIEDRFQRWKLQMTGLAWVRKNRNIQLEARRWARFYRKVVTGGLR